MALVRILVDGYSLLHNWSELAPGKSRHSAAAREELIAVLIQYHDACGTPVTIFFDGSGSARDRRKTPATRGVEILYSRAGQTADDLIERATHRFQDYGEVLVVTDDFAERDTVNSLGGLTSSCDNFVRTVEAAMADLQKDIQNYNQKERAKFHAH